MLLLQDPLTTTLTFTLSSRRLNCISFQTAGLHSTYLLKNARGILLCILSCLPSFNVGPLLPLTSIVMQTRFIIHSWPGPLHTSVNTVDSRWAWMRFSDQPSHMHTCARAHTHKDTKDWHTCYPNQITPLFLLQRSGVRSLCLAGVHSRVKRWTNRKTGRSRS